MATKNSVYPNEAKVLAIHDGTIIAANNTKIVGAKLQDLAKMQPHLAPLVTRVMQNEEITAAMVDTSGKRLLQHMLMSMCHYSKMCIGISLHSHLAVMS